MGASRDLGPVPPRLALSVALVSAATLLIELLVTRFFSVLFFYHYSFFAVALVMTGLSLGGWAASRWDLASEPDETFGRRLASLAILAALGTAGALLCLLAWPQADRMAPPATGTVVLVALAFVPALTAAGTFLAAAFARDGRWIGRLYAADLVAAALACVGAIALLRLVQGLAALLLPVLLAALAGLTLGPHRRWARVTAGLLTLGAAAGMTLNVISEGAFLRLPLAERPLLERWNEHSRVLVLPKAPDPDSLYLVIDKTAATEMARVRPRRAGEPVPVERWWGQGVSGVGYRLGRPIRRAAVIGVGGGRDVLAALANGAERVDGYELNGILVDLLRERYAAFNGVASWPEVSLIHGEARVGIARSGRTYDVIQASLIDTWAATAGGGFVLSENGLYTVEGWRTFLGALSGRGLLTMTRFYLPGTPAEVERLVSLASAALGEEGVRDPGAHVIVVAAGREAESARTLHTLATILVSKPPFTADEVARVRRICEEEGMHLLAAPGMPSRDPVIARLLDPLERAGAIAQSPFDISAPSDLRPYFFMQVRPRDVLALGGQPSFVLAVTFKAVRVMMLLAGLALGFAAAVFLAALGTRPGASPTPAQRRTYRWMSVYFLGIGLGYVLIQLGLHQRLILILGHPTLALAVVLAFMLLGTGLGSLATDRWVSRGRLVQAWLCILAALALLVAGAPALGLVNAIGAAWGRIGAVAALMGVTGFVLGFGFPLGIRLVAPTGGWAVQKMWAINGAASIAGAALAAVVGVWLGSHVVLATGLGCYAVAVLSGCLARRDGPLA